MAPPWQSHFQSGDVRARGTTPGAVALIQDAFLERPGLGSGLSTSRLEVGEGFWTPLSVPGPVRLRFSDQ